MKILTRFLMVSLILAFAVGNVVHGVAGSSMSVKMSAASGDMVPGCDGCGGGDGDNGKVEKVCVNLCVASAVAVLPTLMPVAARVSETVGLPVAGLITDPSGPPDPYPPKPALN